MIYQPSVSRLYHGTANCVFLLEHYATVQCTNGATYRCTIYKNCDLRAGESEWQLQTNFKLTAKNLNQRASTRQPGPIPLLLRNPPSKSSVLKVYAIG